MVYKLPLKKNELKWFLETGTIFKRMSKLSLEIFMKYLFP